MPDEEFQPEDLRLINLILPHYPEVVDVIRAVKQAVGRATYPIQNFEELSTALGGLTIAGGSFTLSEAQALLPPYYFPIGSEEDLIAKVADLRAQAGGMSALPTDADVTWLEPAESSPRTFPAARDCIEDVPTIAGCAGVKNLQPRRPLPEIPTPRAARPDVSWPLYRKARFEHVDHRPKLSQRHRDSQRDVLGRGLQQRRRADTS